MKDEIVNILLGSIPVSYDHTKPAREYINEATDQILTLLDKEKEKAFREGLETQVTLKDNTERDFLISNGQPGGEK